LRLVSKLLTLEESERVQARVRVSISYLTNVLYHEGDPFGRRHALDRRSAVHLGRRRRKAGLPGLDEGELGGDGRRHLNASDGELALRYREG